MTATCTPNLSARDLLPALAPVSDAYKSDRLPVWETSVACVAGLAMTAFGAIWILSSAPAAAEGNGCRIEASVACTGWTALTAAGLVASGQ